MQDLGAAVGPSPACGGGAKHGNVQSKGGGIRDGWGVDASCLRALTPAFMDPSIGKCLERPAHSSFVLFSFNLSLSLRCFTALEVVMQMLVVFKNAPCVPWNAIDYCPVDRPCSHLSVSSFQLCLLLGIECLSPSSLRFIC